MKELNVSNWKLKEETSLIPSPLSVQVNVTEKLVTRKVLASKQNLVFASSMPIFATSSLFFF